MDFRALNWKILIGIFVFVLGFLFVGQFLYSEFYQAQPLKRALLEDDQILDAEINRQDGKVIVKISLAKMDDIQQGHFKIREMIEERLGHENYELKIQDNRNELLNNVWYNSQYAVYEAAARGNFQEMSEKIENYSNAAGLSKSLVFLDGNSIYLQLEDGEHYLYEIVEIQDNTRLAGGVIAND